MDARVKRGPNCGSDHYLVTAKLVYPFRHLNQNNWKSHEKPKTQEINQYNLHLLQQESIRQLYQNRLNEKLMNLQENEDVNIENFSITTAVHEAAFEALGQQEKNNRKNLEWWNDELKVLRVEKENAYKKWLCNRTTEQRTEYKDRNKEFKKRIIQEKNIMWEKRCQRIESQIGGSQSTEAWNIVKSLKTNNTSRKSLLKMETLETHYRTLLTEGRPEFIKEEESIKNTDELLEMDISKIDIDIAIESMKNGKSSGPGGISVELIKYGGDRLKERIRKLIDRVIKCCKIPKEWKISHISSIYKKGDRRDPKNYRGISVNGTLSRLFSKVLQKRLQKECIEKIDENQSGFIPGRSCVDNLFIIQQLIEKHMSHNHELFLAFIDLEKAYDSVPHSNLWKVMADRDKWNNIKRVLTVNVAYVKIGNELSDPIEVTKGLRQGCSLSPVLFNIYLEETLDHWKKSCQGM